MKPEVQPARLRVRYRVLVAIGACLLGDAAMTLTHHVQKVKATASVSGRLRADSGDDYTLTPTIKGYDSQGYVQFATSWAKAPDCAIAVTSTGFGYICTER